MPLMPAPPMPMKWTRRKASRSLSCPMVWKVPFP